MIVDTVMFFVIRNSILSISLKIKIVKFLPKITFLTLLILAS